MQVLDEQLFINQLHHRKAGSSKPVVIDLSFTTREHWSYGLRSRAHLSQPLPLTETT